MTQAVITKKINKTSEEIRDLMKKSKRKLLELEVLLSLSEIKEGKFEIVKDAHKFFKKLK